MQPSFLALESRVRHRPEDAARLVNPDLADGGVRAWDGNCSRGYVKLTSVWSPSPKNWNNRLIYGPYQLQLARQ
jgi:hypothetical protein